MTRFFGEVGYGDSVETPPESGVWVDTIFETKYYGDVIRTARQLQHGVGLNDDIVVNNSISIVADDFAFNNFMKIKYIRWDGVLWTVSNVIVQRPRLILSLGKVYNGPTA